jgi:hypothetical protein
MNKFVFKRGGTLILDCVYTKNGVPQDVTNVTVSCQLKKSNGRALVATLSYSIPEGATTGQFILQSSGSTSAWPAEMLLGDIKYVDDGKTYYDESFQVDVQDPVTQ